MKIAPHHFGAYCNDINESIDFYCKVLGFRHLFSAETMEGDKPLKMAWIRSDGGVVIELLEQLDKSTNEAAGKCLNHIAVRVDDMDAVVRRLCDHGVAVEAGPFDALCPFDRPLGADDSEIFASYGPKGAKLKIMFFRGPAGERIEAVQDNIGAIE